MSGRGKRVLQDYFDHLLIDDAQAPGGSAAPVVAHAAEPRPEPEPQVAFAGDELAALEQSKRERLQALLNSKPLVATRSEPAPAALPVAPPVSEPELEAEPTAVAVPPDEPPVEDEAELVSQFLAWHENGRPHWAQERFEALLFNVAGLKLAVPLIALGQIHPLTDELTPLFGQADWFMGLLPTSGGNVRTVNTALFVMPEKYDPQFLASARYVVSIDGVPWGLAVDSIEQPVSLDPDDVKWRSERGKRPWLAGTVKSAMCALIDIPQMGRMLTEADGNKAH